MTRFRPNEDKDINTPAWRLRKQNISILRSMNNGVSFQEALKLAKGKTIASNAKIDSILQDEEERKKYADMFACRTGTVLIYEAPGKPFGSSIDDEGLKFNIPKEYQGMKDKALLLEHPDYTVEGNTIKANPEDIRVIPIPREGGWFLPDDNGIPNGATSTESNKDARYLYRRDTASVRPLVRYNYGYDRRFVSAFRRRDDGLGVGVVEPSAKLSPKI